VLGGIATALVGLFLVVLLAIAIKEYAAFARLKRIDGIHRAADAALVAEDLGAARQVSDRLVRLYRDRPDMEWGSQRLADRQGDVFDADGLLGLVEKELLAPLDAAARKEVEAAARQVATVTAIVPLALADVFTALTANLRMIRRIAEIYGGRAGTLGSWRLTRSVLTHLVATGAVAVGDDLIGSVAGGSVLSKISRRFGEGVVNGALTARVGVAAIEVCRPLPFRAERRPSVTSLV
jgi:putative membrane protein